MADEEFKCKYPAVQEYYDTQKEMPHYKNYPRALVYLKETCRSYDKQWEAYEKDPKAKLKEWWETQKKSVQVALGAVYSPARCCAITWEEYRTKPLGGRHMIFMSRKALKKVPYEELKETAVFQDGDQEVHITWKVKPKKVKEVKNVQA